MNRPGKNLYQVFFKTLTAPATAPKDVAWVHAANERDAIRIVSENLDSRQYEVTGAAFNPDEWRISASDMTIGFRNPHTI